MRVETRLEKLMIEDMKWLLWRTLACWWEPVKRRGKMPERGVQRNRL